MSLIKRGAGGKILRGPGGLISRCCCETTGPCSACQNIPASFSFGLNGHIYTIPNNIEKYYLWGGVTGTLNFSPADIVSPGDSKYMFDIAYPSSYWVEALSGCVWAATQNQFHILAVIRGSGSELEIYVGVVDSTQTGAARIVGMVETTFNDDSWSGACPKCGDAYISSFGAFDGSRGSAFGSGWTVPGTGPTNAWIASKLCGSADAPTELRAVYNPVIWFASWQSNMQGGGGWAIMSASPTQDSPGPQCATTDCTTIYCGAGAFTHEEWIENPRDWYGGTCYTGDYSDIMFVSSYLAMPPPPDSPETLYHTYSAMPDCATNQWTISYMGNSPYNRDGYPLNEWVSGPFGGMIYIKTEFSTPTAPSTPPACYCDWMCDYDCGTNAWGAPYQTYCYEGWGEMPWQVYGTQAYCTVAAGTTPDAPTEPGQCE